VRRQELPWPSDIASFYGCIRHLPWAFWLDSGGGHKGPGGRWHILVAAPRWRIVSEGRGTRLTGPDARSRWLDEPPLEVIRAKLAERPRSPIPGLPFTGGALGYLSYDFGRRLMGMPTRSSGFPELAMGIFDWAILADREAQRCWLVGDSVPGGLVEKLEAAAREAAISPQGAGLQGRPRHLVNKKEYACAFRRIQHYLREGDCYQVNYAQPFEAGFTGDTLPLYITMREQNPAPYGAYLPFPFGHVLSSSPEQFLQLSGGVVATRPIKGTRPRGATAEEDQRLTEELQASEKDRAENLMIVDLLRNDLGRVCEPGSIEVPALFEVKKFTTVLHLVSTVRGRLRSGIGYDGNMDTNIAIRTLLAKDGKVTYWAGGGIVADSKLEEEYQESLDKAAAFFRLFGGHS